MQTLRKLVAPALVAAALVQVPALAQAPVRIGMAMFLSGPAAAPFGVPAKNAADLVVKALNAGQVPVPYATKGYGGAPLETVIIDEAGSTTTQVTEFRNLVQRDKVDLVIGYVSSGNCLAVAPVAEELKKLTDFFDCGTPRIFEDARHKYLFRTSPTATMDSVGAALYVHYLKPNLKSIAGINQNYAWGQDSWGDFVAAMKQIVPGVEIKTSQMPKLFAGQYNAEISTLLAAHADVIHSSFFDGDLEALLLQGAPRGLFKRSLGVLTTGETAMYKLAAQIPDGTVIGARGPFGPYAPDSVLNRWFWKAYEAEYHAPPNYASYQMVQAILGVKAAWEKAQQANGGKRPTQEQVGEALTHLTFVGPGGEVRMAIGAGHQAIMDTAYGQSKVVNGKMTIVNIRTYPAEQVNPPDGIKAADWIKNGFRK